MLCLWTPINEEISSWGWPSSRRRSTLALLIALAFFVPVLTKCCKNSRSSGVSDTFAMER
jgi:hypothetical protein